MFRGNRLTPGSELIGRMLSAAREEPRPHISARWGGHRRRLTGVGEPAMLVAHPRADRLQRR